MAGVFVDLPPIHVTNTRCKNVGRCCFRGLVGAWYIRISFWLFVRWLDRDIISLDISSWVDAQANLPTRARWIAKANVAP